MYAASRHAGYVARKSGGVGGQGRLISAASSYSISNFIKNVYVVLDETFDETCIHQSPLTLFSYFYISRPHIRDFKAL